MLLTGVAVACYITRIKNTRFSSAKNRHHQQALQNQINRSSNSILIASTERAKSNHNNQRQSIEARGTDKQRMAWSWSWWCHQRREGEEGTPRAKLVVRGLDLLTHTATTATTRHRRNNHLLMSPPPNPTLRIATACCRVRGKGERLMNSYHRSDRIHTISVAPSGLGGGRWRRRNRGGPAAREHTIDQSPFSFFF